MTPTDIPADIFTEQDPVDPDTLANLGPLRPLAGTWQGLRGVDVAPKAEGPDRREYQETLTIQPIDPQSNGPQLLYGLRYHHHITTLIEDITFHDQVGYWLWEPATGLIMLSLTIPRGQAVLAHGQAKPGDKTLSLRAQRGQTNYGIVSTDFLEGAFRTDAYDIQVTFNDDGTLSYVQTTTLMVRGEPTPFKHIDRSKLTRTAEPKPNPWQQIILDRQKAEQAG